jgi:drug/metabolite transporter (DMT)-like permease
LAIELFLVSSLSAVFFALGIVLSQSGLKHLPPLSGAAISVPTSAVFLLALSPVTVDWAGFEPRAALVFAVAGLFYPASVTLLNFVSNRRLGPNLTAAMGNLTPLFAIVLAVLILREYPGLGQLTGVGVILAGLFLISADRIRHLPTSALLVLLIPLCGALIRGAVQPVVKLGFTDWPDAFAAATISYIVSASLITLARRRLVKSAPPANRTAIAWFIAIGIANGLALLTLYLSLSMGPVATVAPIVATYPLITYAMTRLILNQREVSGRALAGIALSVVGVILLTTL